MIGGICRACERLKGAEEGREMRQCYVCKRNLFFPIQPLDSITVHPENQGKRDIKRPRHDLIPVEFLDELASIFEEGLPKYGDSWKKGGKGFLTDCLNHASNHLHLYMNGDTSENQLAKVAWNALAVRWHDLKNEKQTNRLPTT